MKTVLITGASRGIGAATARACAARGWSVALNHLANAEDAADAAQVAAQVQAAGARAALLPGDVTQEADILAMWDGAEAALGPVTGFVNNAGIVGPVGKLADFSAERIARIVAVNVTGAILGAREAARRMSTARGGPGGAIVNLASLAATTGAGNSYVDYAATKGAMVTLTTGLARELAPEGIRVNCVRPGLIDTVIHALSEAPERIPNAGQIVPLGRAGTAEEVAESIVWLLSDAASYVTGAAINVDGGF